MTRVAAAVLLLALLATTSCATGARRTCSACLQTHRVAESGQASLITEQTLLKVQQAIDSWKALFQMYPPSAMRRIHIVAGVGRAASASGINEGIEAVYQALYWPGFKDDPQFTDAELCNTDEDRLLRAVNRHGVPDLLEICDGWGNPLIYFDSGDYAEYATGGPVYITADGEEVEPVPHKYLSGAFSNPTSFQLFSMGPDAKPNTADDVVAWDR